MTFCDFWILMLFLLVMLFIKSMADSARLAQLREHNEFLRAQIAILSETLNRAAEQHEHRSNT